MMALAYLCVHRHLVGREQLRPRRHTVFLREKGQKGVADLKLLDDGAEAVSLKSAIFTSSIKRVKVHHLPIAAALVQQACLQLLKVLHTQLAQAWIQQYRHPRHDRRDLTVPVNGQAVA